MCYVSISSSATYCHRKHPSRGNPPWNAQWSSYEVSNDTWNEYLVVNDNDTSINDIEPNQRLVVSHTYLWQNNEFLLLLMHLINYIEEKDADHQFWFNNQGFHPRMSTKVL